MRFSTVFSALAITATATATASTVPAELFSIGQPSEALKVSYHVGSSTVSISPGQSLNSTVTHEAPHLHLKDMDLGSDGPYVLLMVDPTTNKTNPLSVALHALVSNLMTNDSSGNVIAKYVYPQPREGPAHNYTLFLFKQPASFVVSEQYHSFLETKETPLNRLNFPLVNFLKQMDLGKPVAANYFREAAESSSSSTKTTKTTGTADATVSSTGSASASASSGAAGRSFRETNGFSYLASSLVGAMIAAVL
ncbi:hypothetical protein EYZ11_008387 [Aspergillus tanneri]|uniref:PEBP-like protein n=1 Tax=Aspergillus tanneri TaxID=1220188 RepID=A0A4S3JAX4_9EURO|nr:uncharacterized protein ATNIH1004_003747 [Aspergillus tanneri]KAA8651054.1 hypothetical protein ATNIH1004_003747 [Aspergillus tanneri]THC92142.1 hypothetical protein EYZ11_008387 [Aspergillus tanneri]